MTNTELCARIASETKLALEALQAEQIQDCIDHLRLANAAALELQRRVVGCGAPPIRP